MKWLKWLIVLVVVAGAAVVLRLTVLAPKPVRVRVATVDRGEVEETVTNTRAGTVKVRLRARLSPQMGGLVVALPHREGTWVASGDLLLKLDDRAQRAQLELARRDVAAADQKAEEACLTADLAEKELTRMGALHRQEIASDQALDMSSTDRDRSRAGCAAARAAVAEAHAAVAVAQVQLDFTEVRAPFPGTVADLTTEVGEWITPAPPGVPIPPVIDLLDPASVYISAPIDEVDAERVAVGQEARIAVDSRPDQRYEAKVVRVAPYVLDVLEQNRTVEVEVELADAAQAVGILPGTSADVEIILQRRADTLRIPTAAVSDDDNVLVLADGRLDERQIKVGLRNWQVVEVLDGLQPGEQVVTSRLSTDIRPGVRAEAR
jgi:HlyD family secretion protein